MSHYFNSLNEGSVKCDLVFNQFFSVASLEPGVNREGSRGTRYPKQQVFREHKIETS